MNVWGDDKGMTVSIVVFQEKRSSLRVGECQARLRLCLLVRRYVSTADVWVEENGKLGGLWSRLHPTLCSLLVRKQEVGTGSGCGCRQLVASDYCVPLTVWWWRHDSAGFEREVGHVLWVFGNQGGSHVSILLDEELGTGRGRAWLAAGSATCPGRQTVLPILGIIKGHLELLPAHFARGQSPTSHCFSSVPQHAGRVGRGCGGGVGVALVGWQATVTWWATPLRLGLAHRVANWSCPFQGGVGV